MRRAAGWSKHLSFTNRMRTLKRIETDDVTEWTCPLLCLSLISSAVRIFLTHLLIYINIPHPKSKHVTYIYIYATTSQARKASPCQGAIHHEIQRTVQHALREGRQLGNRNSVEGRGLSIGKGWWRLTRRYYFWWIGYWIPSRKHNIECQNCMESHRTDQSLHKARFP